MSRIHLCNHPDEIGAGEAAVDPLLVSGSMMSHDMPQKGSEPQRSDGVYPGTSINIGESEMKIAHKARLGLMRLRLWLIVAIVLIVILLLGNGGLIALTTAIYKDTYVKGDTTLSNARGQVVGTRAATHNLPLLVAPVLPDNELFSAETIHFKVPTINLGPNGTSGGKGGLSDVASSRRISVRVSRVEKVNSTAVVFYGIGGEEIRVWNGVTTARLSATGAETTICSADVTCAAFQVEGAELAEKYLAEAEAALEPFAESRRRLLMACEPKTEKEAGPIVRLPLRNLCHCVPYNRRAFKCRRYPDRQHTACALDEVCYAPPEKLVLYGDWGELCLPIRPPSSPPPQSPPPSPPPPNFCHCVQGERRSLKCDRDDPQHTACALDETCYALPEKRVPFGHWGELCAPTDPGFCHCVQGERRSLKCDRDDPQHTACALDEVCSAPPEKRVPFGHWGELCQPAGA